MGNNLSVSVVITCYNYGRYLENCLNSVFQQTFKDFEILLIDDGSTDHTQDVVAQFRDKPNLNYFYQKNQGQANAKNNGIKHSKGDFIAFLDADDIWAEDKLEKQISLFESDKVCVVYSRSNYIDENGKPLAYKLSGKYLLPRRGQVTEFLFLDNFVPFSSAVVRKECFKNCGLFDESLKMAIDWDLWLRISTEYHFDYVNEPLLKYRVGHSDQMSKNAFVRNSCCDKIMERFLENNKDLLSKKIIRKAYAFTFCNRGKYYAEHDWSKSIKYYLSALILDPIEIDAYKGLLRALLVIKNRVK